jgi:hypothetical protein
MSASFYTSDSPCRRCNGTQRFRNTSKKGQCASCVKGDEGERKAKSFIVEAREMSSEDDPDTIELPFVLEVDE